MFVRQNQQQFRNSNADVQIFYGNVGPNGYANYVYTWNKPVGVNNIYIMLIGPGGQGDGSTGGGSGGVTVWFGAAKNVPDVLYLFVPSGYNGRVFGAVTKISTNTSQGNPNSNSVLLSAKPATGISGATATTANQFGNSGFYQSIAGQDGFPISGSPSGGTFLTSGSNGYVTANYGYQFLTNYAGFFLLQPMIVGLGGSTSGVTNVAYGCGGGGSGLTEGGSGLAIIASW